MTLSFLPPEGQITTEGMQLALQPTPELRDQCKQQLHERLNDAARALEAATHQVDQVRLGLGIVLNALVADKEVSPDMEQLITGFLDGNEIVMTTRTIRHEAEFKGEAAVLVLGLSISPEDSEASVVACGEDTTGTRLQSTVVASGEGVDWLFPSDRDPQGVLGRLVEKYDHPYLVVNEKQVAHLLPEIENVVGFDRVQRREPKEMQEVWAFRYRLVDEGRLKSTDGESSTVTSFEAQQLAASFWIGAWATTG